MKNFLDREGSKKNKDKVVEKNANKDQVISLKEKVVNRKIISILLVFVIALGTFSFLGLGGKNLLSNLRDLFDGNQEIGRKTITPNKIGEQFDGTYKLSLTVTGDAERKPQKANIIVVFDTSSSMNRSTNNTEVTYTPDDSYYGNYANINGEYIQLEGDWDYRNNQWVYVYYYNGSEYTGQRYSRQEANQSRLQAAQSATNSLAKALLENNGRDGNPTDTIEIALVDFANMAEIAQTPTTDYDTFAAKVNSRNAGNNNRGTNWEAGFRTALDVDFGDEDTTYVIFVSDGNPTYYVNNNGTRGGSGQETTNNINTSYNQAVPAAKAVVDAGYNLYTIGIYGNVDRMEDITTDAGAPIANYFSADDTAALQAAFGEILSKIEMSGIGNVDIVDGTTNKVATSSGVAKLLEIDKNSFQYWRTKDGVRTEWKKTDDPAPPSAEFVESTGEVKWDLSSLGILENDVTYEVTFDVYPSQETYDLIADLKNDKIDYDTEVDPAIKKYLHKNGDSYSLDTNTVDENGKSTATITYTDTRTDDGEQTYTYTNPDPFATDASSISIKKTWDNGIDTRTERPVSVNLQRDGENFYPAELNAANNFELKDIAIAVGLARLNGETLTVLDTGHDYKFAELGSESYNWELETETVHPMLINGEIKKLILVEDESTIPSAMGDKTYYDGYYKLGNKYYKDEGTNPTIHAINHRRSNFNVKKIVNGENANPNDTFEFTIRVTQKGEDGQAIADDTTTNNDDIWFSICDTEIDSTCKDPNSLVKDESLVTGAQKEMRDGAWTGYYYVTNTTEVKVKLKDKYNLRFTNLLSNTDFSVVEGNTTNYELEKIETTSGFDSNKDRKSISGKTITGHIGQSNKIYQVEYTNKNTNPETVEASVKKVWNDNDDQDGIRPDTLTVTLSNGQTATLSDDNDWEATITGLPKWKDGEEVEYTWSEESLPDGYEMISNNTVGTLTTITNKHESYKTNISVEKVWDDENNQDGLRTAIEVELFKIINDVESTTGKTQTLNAGNNWFYEFTGLDKNADGVPILYIVRENTRLAGYDAPIYSNPINEGKVTITNKHTPYTKNVGVKKVWDDERNQDGKRPTELSVKLMAGDEIITTVKLNEGNQWTQVVNVPLNKDGEEVEYTWVEESIEGYKLTDTDVTTLEDETILTSITNKYEPAKDTIVVTKVWEDANDQDGIRPDDVTFTVTGSDGKTYTKTFSGQGNRWTQEVEVNKYYNGGQEVTFTVDEADVSSYTKSIDNSKLTITNTHEPEKDKITVTKVWDDSSNQDGKRPENVTFTVTGSDGKTYTKTFGGQGNTWTQEVEIDKLYDGGKEVTFTVDEADVAEYTKSINNDNLTITNSYTTKTTSLTVTKVWDDANDQDGKRKDVNAKVTLYADGTAVDRADATVDVSTDAGWSKTWSNLPVFNDGKEITYSVRETFNENSGYTKSGDDSNLKASEDSTSLGTVTITNKYTPEEDTITVTKIWDDASDQDGIRPDDVTFTVTGSDGKTYTETFSGSGNTWTKEIKVNKYYNGGQEVTFTVDEANISSYTKSIDNSKLTITNSYEPEKDTITVTKIWEDANDQDGIRPDDVTFTVTGSDGKTYTETFSGSGNTWTKEIKVNKYYNGGQEVTFTVDEANISSYTKSIDNSKLTITNSYEPEKDTITVTKIWEDANDQDRIRPDDVTFTVTGSDGKTYPVTFSGQGNTWTKDISVDKLYDGGKTVTFTVDEADVSQYTKSIDNSKLTITNSYQPAKTNVSVEKVWDDNNNQDGLRAAIEVELFKIINEVESTTGKKATLDETNNWFATFTGLDKNADGVPILYTVRENTKLTDYEEPVYSAPVSEGKVTITNKHTAYTTSVSVKKVWDDASNQDGKRPDSITVTLMDGDDEVKDVTLSESNSWTATVSGLPLNRDGKAIEYTWVEKNVPDGYKVTGNSTKDSLTTITNTHEPKMINIPVKKEWDNSKNKFGFDNPTKVKVYLKDGDTILEDATLEEANNWSATFNNYPMYKDGKEIAYMVEEEALADYITDISGNPTNGFVIKNTYSPELINIGVNKEWADNSDQDGIRPTSIYVKLIGKVGEETVYTSERTEISDLNTKDTWTYTFEKLPSTYYGEKITYSVEEEKVDGYDTPSYSGDIKTNLIVTNPYVPQTISYHVTKAWDDNDDHDGIRPESITVILKADGEKIDEKVLNEENGWSYEFIDLPKYKDHGTSISYTIEEVTVDKYESSISVNDEGTSAVITNKHDNEKVYIDITKSWDDNNNELGLRPDSITVNILANGEIYKTVKLTSENNWKITVEVDKYIDKEEAVYTIDEVSVNDYISTINGFNIINKLNHTEIVPPNTLVEVNNTSDGLISIITVLTTLGVTALSIRKRYE